MKRIYQIAILFNLCVSIIVVSLWLIQWYQSLPKYEIRETSPNISYNNQYWENGICYWEIKIHNPSDFEVFNVTIWIYGEYANQTHITSYETRDFIPVMKPNEEITKIVDYPFVNPLNPRMYAKGYFYKLIEP